MKRAFRVDYFHDGEGRLLEDCTVCVGDGRIARIGQDMPDGGWEHVDCGGFMLPGLVNSHHHAYSALARGIPAGKMDGFPERLEKLWWKLDRALDLEDVHVSALVTAMDCVRHGCTSVIDHHSSQAAVRGSLERVASGFGKLGIRCVTCFETSDRSGEVVEEAIEENLEFERTHRDDPGVRGMFGLHASFTLETETLERVARLKPEDVPVHVHVAEDACDVEHARKLGFEGPLARLDGHGLLADGSIIAHGIHLSDREYEIARKVWIAHNPESNMNNRVGYADLDRFDAGRVLLGTDGMSSNMLGSLKAAFLAYSGWGGRRRDPMEVARDILLVNPGKYLTGVFGQAVGRIREGEVADFAIFPYTTPTDLGGENWLAHVLYALTNTTLARWVYAGGRCVVQDGRIAAVDEEEVMAEARGRARAVWKKYMEM